MKLKATSYFTLPALITLIGSLVLTSSKAQMTTPAESKAHFGQAVSLDDAASSTPGNSSEGQAFTVKPGQSITVTALGMYNAFTNGLVENHTLYISTNGGSYATLASVSIGPGTNYPSSGNYLFQALNTPVTLGPGSYIMWVSWVDANDGYYLNPSAMYDTAGITYGDSYWGASNSVPRINSDGRVFGAASFQFYGSGAASITEEGNGIDLSAATVIIILPSEPTRVERFAANELRKYLSAATDAKVAISKGVPASMPAAKIFWVGNLTYDGRLVQNSFPVSGLRGVNLIEDGVCVDSDGKQTMLVGQGDRGALNAVYTYLEYVVGCHWPEPGREFVPHLADWSPPKVHLVFNPQFPWRGVALHGGCSKENFAVLVDWLSKNRMNAFQVFPLPYEDYRPLVLNAVLDRGLMPNIGGHSREFYLSTDKYRAEHPDWFATNQGKKTEQLDYSDYDSAPTYASNAVAFLKTHPEIKIVSLWPNDGWGFSDTGNSMDFPGNPTDLMLAYVNRVAEGIHEKVPGVKCEFLAYINYLAAPLWVKPEPYVIPTFCEHYGSIGARDHWYPIADDRAANKVLREELGKWIARSDQVTEFSYYGDDCIKRFLYHPLADVMVADCHYYHQAGLAGNFVILTNPEKWWSNALTLYAYARAAWDGNLTADQIESDYYNSLYGPAAEAMEKHEKAVLALYDISPAKMNSQGNTLEGAVDITGKDYATVLTQYSDGISQADKALEEARTLSTDAWVKERIEKLQSDTDYVGLWCQIQCGQQQLAADKSANLKAHVLAMIDSAFKLDVVTNDDAHGYRSIINNLNSVSNSVAATSCNRP